MQNRLFLYLNEQQYSERYSERYSGRERLEELPVLRPGFAALLAVDWLAGRIEVPNWGSW